MTMRKYEQIWQQIKKRDKCVVQIVHPALVERVKKGVIKEKDRDLGFKVMNDVEPFRLEIAYDRETQQMSFKLTQRLGMATKVMVCRLSTSQSRKFAVIKRH